MGDWPARAGRLDDASVDAMRVQQFHFSRAPLHHQTLIDGALVGDLAGFGRWRLLQNQQPRDRSALP